MHSIQEASGDQSKLKATLSKMPLDEIGRMFANCLIRFNQNDPRFGQKAQYRLQDIQQEWRNRSYYLPPGTDRDRPDPGMLKCLGYEVGNDGKTTEVRTAILDYLMQEDVLPPIKDALYVSEWGIGRSRKRYHKCYRAISAFIDENERSPYHKEAVRNWANDLKYLEKKWNLLWNAPDNKQPL